MRSILIGVTFSVGAWSLAGQPAQPAAQDRPAPGVRLESLAWTEAEPLLTAETVVVLPIGAASKEHGPHLKLRNDLTLADHLTGRVLEASDVVVAPTLTYHFYPAFLEYPGSTSLTAETAQAMTVEVVRSLARYGPRRFYALNTGISTLRALEAASRALAAEGILFRYTNLETTLEPIAGRVQQQEGGTHADELETSMMLYIAPADVDMTRAVKDYRPARPGGLTRVEGARGTYSPTGIWGDPTLATREKGKLLVDTLVNGILMDIEGVRAATPPVPRRARALASSSNARAGRPAGGEEQRGCSEGDFRTIRNLANAYTTHWNNADAQKLGGLYSKEADMVHTDGTVERTREAIISNRIATFGRREYRGSKHPMTLTMVRCVDADVAIADGKWELRGVTDSSGNELPAFEGQVTFVLARSGGGWQIDAHRYTVKPELAKGPVFLKRPGWAGSLIPDP